MAKGEKKPSIKDEAHSSPGKKGGQVRRRKRPTSFPFYSEGDFCKRNSLIRKEEREVEEGEGKKDLPGMKKEALSYLI